jgi:hypothetical protein
VTLSPTSVSFGNQNVNTTSAAHSVTLTNSGTAALSISSLTVGGTNAAEFAETNTCPISPSTLAANGTCTLSVTFTPTSAGAASASVSISDNAGGSPQSLPLTGTGVVSTPGRSLIGTSAANGNFGAGVNIKIPTVQTGDLLIAVTGTNGVPNTWTAPTGWTTGAGGGQVAGQGLNWWWKIASGADSATTITLKASSYADGGGIVLDYRGTSASPILAVSTLAANDNGGNGVVTSAQFNGASWSGSASVVSLLLMSWQPTNATVSWPAGYAAQGTATDGYAYAAVGADLSSQSASSLNSQTATLSISQAVVPTLQIAVAVGG